jgi:hypothetical protein
MSYMHEEGQVVNTCTIYFNSRKHCTLYLWVCMIVQKAINSLNNINYFLSVTVKSWVFFAVRTEFLNII